MGQREATDPAKAKKMKEAQANIDKEVDPEKAKAALEALEKTLRTGDLFADMQVKAALTAYAQNRGLYADLKADSQKATGILDKNLAERRETSSQQWAETAQAVDDAMRSIGDAIRPATDMAAKGLTAVAQGITTLSDKFPAVIMGLAGLAAGISGLLAVRSGAKVARGAFNVARGRAWSARRGGKLEEAPAEAALPKTGNRVLDAGMGALGKVFGVPASNDPAPGVGSEPQRVFVVNADAIGRFGGSVANSGPAEAGSRRARRRRRRAGTMADVRRAPGASVPAAKAPAVHLPAAGASALAGAAEAAGEANKLGRMVRSVRGIKALDTLPDGQKPVRVFYDTTDNAEAEIALTNALHSLNTDGQGLDVGNVDEGYDIGRRLGNTGVSSALVEINLATIASYHDGGASAVVYAGSDGSLTVQMISPPDEARKAKNQQNRGADPFKYGLPSAGRSKS